MNDDDEFHRMQDDLNRIRATATGFRDDTTENEVEILLTSAIVEVGMSKERIQIKCPAKPITHAFLQCTDSEERDKYIRSANMQKRELIESITCAMDADERFQERLGYIKCCLNKKHEIPLNRVKKHVSVRGQEVVRTCENGSPKYHQFQNVEKEVEAYTDYRLSKNSSRRL